MKIHCAYDEKERAKTGKLEKKAQYTEEEEGGKNKKNYTRK